MDLASAQDIADLAQVAQAAVGAGADDDLIDLHVLDLVGRLDIVGQARQGDDRPQVGHVDLDDAGVVGVRIGGVGGVGLVGDGVDVRPVLSSQPKMPVSPPASIAMLAIVIRPSIGSASSRAGELHGRVERAIDADQADGVQDQVLAEDVLRPGAVVDELDRLRHPHPGRPRAIAAAMSVEPRPVPKQSIAP